MNFTQSIRFMIKSLEEEPAETMYATYRDIGFKLADEKHFGKLSESAYDKLVAELYTKYLDMIEEG